MGHAMRHAATCCTLTSPGSSRILSLAGVPSGGSTPVCGGMERQAKRFIHPTGSHSAPMIAHGQSNEEQVLSPEETRWEVRCDMMESDCSSRSC